MSFGMPVTPGYYPAAYVMWQPAQSAAPQPFAIPQPMPTPMPVEYFAQGAIPANAAATDTVAFNRQIIPNPGVYNDIQNHGVQRYLPINERRDFSAQEQAAIQKGLKQWWPKIGAGYTTPIPQLLASPAKASVLYGLLGSFFVNHTKKGSYHAETSAWPACGGGPALVWHPGLY